MTKAQRIATLTETEKQYLDDPANHAVLNVEHDLIEVELEIVVAREELRGLYQRRRLAQAKVAYTFDFIARLESEVEEKVARIVTQGDSSHVGQSAV